MLGGVTSILAFWFIICTERLQTISANRSEAVPGTESANQLLHRFWQWKLLNNPEFATSIGIFKYDDRLGEMSLSSYARRADEIRMFLNELQNITQNVHVHPSLALDLDLLETDLKQYLSGMKFKPYVWPINILESPHVGLTNIISIMKKDDSRSMTNLLTRMRFYPQIVDEIIELMREGIWLGMTMHKISFEKLIKVFQTVASTDFSESHFLVPFQERPVAISSQKWKAYVKTAKSIVQKSILPSFERLYHFLRDEYLPRSRSNIAASSLPNGNGYYRACLKFHTTTDLSPLQVHEIGLKEVARITCRMKKVKNRVKFSGHLSEFRQYLRTDKKFGFKSSSDIMAHYEKIETKVRKNLSRYFGMLPNLTFVIAPIPDELASTAPIGYYQHPSPDGSRPGKFFVNTYQPKTKRKYTAMSLFLHEAIPGHHLQIAIKMTNGSPLLFRRYTGMAESYYEVPASFSMNSAYTEGWGLYSEYLGEEMGLYKDPYDLFGRLSGEMLRACRLVVDTGMHYLGWSRDKAISYMKENTAEALNSIIAEIDRYITWPGQACAYKIGEMKLREMRSVAMKELDKLFDIRKFHDFILSVGNVPLNVLEKQVNLFIKRELNL